MFDSFLNHYALSANWVDLVLFAAILIFIFTSTGFIESLLELLGFLGSIIISFETYPLFGKLLTNNFTIPRGIANAVGFFMAWFIAESVIYIITLILLSKFLTSLRARPLNRTLRFIPSVLHACVIYLFFMSLIFALPVRGSVKSQIMQSRTAPFFITISQSLEHQIKTVFGQAVSESLYFLTIKPKSNETVDLGFKATEKDLSTDTQSEALMLTLVNTQRGRADVKILKEDVGLRLVARNYARHMMLHGFFSHVSKVDGTSALERANREGLIFSVIGENLAFAPDTNLAHQGLMNSPGHRANIVSADYGRVGIGVVDGGVYGKMFVQVFTD